MIITRRAIPDDAQAISALLTTNASDRGGMLYGIWSIGVVREWMASGALVVVATDGPSLAGVLFTSEKTQAAAAPVVAMLRCWPGSDDAYIYGPVCIDKDARGKGVLQALYAEVEQRLPDREAILFINERNVPSLRAHSQLGFTHVSDFWLGEERFHVFSSLQSKP